MPDMDFFWRALTTEDSEHLVEFTQVILQLLCSQQAQTSETKLQEAGSQWLRLFNFCY